MIARIVLCLFIATVCLSKSVGQTWTFEQCIDRAISENLQIELAAITNTSSEIDLKLARDSRYPNLNASTNLGLNFGRTIDPTSNGFVTESFFNNGFGINSSAVLFNGGKINQTIRQAQFNAQATSADRDKIVNDIILTVANRYLSTLLAKENLMNTENQLELTLSQEKLLRRQIAVGNRPENDVLDILAQVAANEQSVVEAKNNVTIGMMNLRQLLRIDPNEVFDIVAPQAGVDLIFDPDLITFDEVYNSAVGRLAEVKAAELKLQVAQIGEKIANSDLLPSVSAVGSARTNYSNKGISVTGSRDEIVNQVFYINNQPLDVGIPTKVPIFENTTYQNQITQNLSYGAGVQVNIPIYNNFSTRANIQKSKLNRTRSEINLLQIRENLKITIGQAIADAQSAKARYQASNKTLQANKNVYENGLKRLEAGNLNGFEISRLKTQLDAATIATSNAKYEYIFRSKVVEFYLGRTIKL